MRTPIVAPEASGHCLIFLYNLQFINNAVTQAITNDSFLDAWCENLKSIELLPMTLAQIHEVNEHGY